MFNLRTLGLVMGGMLVGELMLGHFHVIPEGMGAFLGAVFGAVMAMVAVLRE